MVVIISVFLKKQSPKIDMFQPIVNEACSLFTTKNIYPAYCFLITDLAQIDLCSF
jgi:hypothetical protein